MRLVKIKLSGFKSFVDPTVIQLPSHLVGVVGPNGCGKSNVIDAVRWVMGESSAKTLRGDSITDVIFNGSVNRKPVGQASVELIFDNSDGRLGGEYAGFAEISVRREVNRDAQSHYYLNGVRCRRKDITRVFLGTGLGPRSYSIIEQGMISRFIEAKPEELRSYLEEVAGISKYKDRRHETELRIQHTRENLARLNDVRGELEKQLQSLQRQANAAERYQELKQEERQLKAEFLTLQHREILSSLSQFELNIQQAETEKEARRAEFLRVEREIEEGRQQQVQETDAFNMLQQNFYRLGNEVTRLEQAIAHKRERERQLQEDRETLEKDYAALNEHLQEDGEKIVTLAETVESTEPDLRRARMADEQASERLLEVEEQLADWQLSWEKFSRDSQTTLARLDLERTKKEHLHAQQQQISERSSALRQEQNLVTTMIEATTMNTLSEEVNRLAQSRTQSQTKLSQYAAELTALRNEEQQLQKMLESARENSHELKAELASLEAVQQAALGATSAEVSTWLTQQGLKDHERLLAKLTVATGWELAVETVMGAYLQAVCVTDIAPYVDPLTALSTGNMALVSASQPADSSINKSPAELLSKIQSNICLNDWLSGIYIASTLQEAEEIRKNLQVGESVITQEGVWFGREWVRINKASDVTTGMVARQKRLEAGRAEFTVLQQELMTQQATLLSLKETITARDHLQQMEQKTFHDINAQWAKAQATLQVKQEEMTRAEKRLQDIAKELNELTDKQQQGSREQSEREKNLEILLEQSRSQEQERDRYVQTRDELKASLLHAKSQAEEAQEALQSLFIQYQTAQSELKTMRLNVERLEQQLTQVRDRREQLQAVLASGDHSDTNLQQELEQSLEQHVSAEKAMQEGRVRLEQCQTQLQTLETTRHQVEQAVSLARDRLEQIKLESEGLRVRATTLIEQLQEMGAELQAVQESLPQDANSGAWQERLAAVEARIIRLGAINLVAIDEFKIQSERKSYLDAQNEDLEKALAVLEEAMSKIDQETKEKFQETFDTINANLQDLFPKVFGGGSASLTMTGESLLDTGVTIMARPPGKKNATIHLLSGGEKALTAVALVFSIFRLNPSPFCLLDEVDAPLDDSNVVRYCNLVKEMATKVQFIFITHNKVAMEMADHLMGVTMQEPGVSRLVTVDVQEAVEMAAM